MHYTFRKFEDIEITNHERQTIITHLLT